MYARVATAKVWTKAPVHHEGVLYRKIYYHPIEPGGYERIKNNIDKIVPFCIIDLGDEELVLACLDGKNFEELIDRKKKQDSKEKHKRSQNQVIKNQRKELDENYQIMLDIVREHYRPGQLPFVQSATEETRPPIPPQLPEESTETKKTETAAEPMKPARNKRQARTTPSSSAQGERSAQPNPAARSEEGHVLEQQPSTNDIDAALPEPVDVPETSPGDATDPFLDQLDQFWS